MCQEIAYGAEFGWLTAVSPIGAGKFWLCDCKCGKKSIKASKWHLVNGKRRSCGCRKRDKANEIRCNKCEKMKSRNEFYWRKNGAIQYSWCKICLGNKVRVGGKERHAKLRFDALTHYAGGKLECKCCQESAIEFLCLDHIDKSGSKHRKELGNLNIYRWLKRMNYPDVPLRVLCFNCNQAHGAYGYCPHDRNRQLT